HRFLTFKQWVQNGLGSGFIRKLIVYAGARAVPTLGTFLFTFVCLQYLNVAEYGKYSLTVLPAMVGGAMVGGLAGQPMLRFGASLSSAELARGLVLIPLIGSLLIAPVVWF